MLAIERQRKILEAAKRHGGVRTQDLASVLNVTEETVRRDLDSLAKQGLLHRTHGGATEVSMLLHEFQPNEREGWEVCEKEAIARLAVKHLRRNESLMLDASTTALEFARHLPQGHNLKIVTYSLDVIERLSIRNDLELVLLGGSYAPKERRVGGLITEMGIRALRIDRFFFSGCGYDFEKGVGEDDAEEARLKATILAHANWSCAMIDHTKLGRAADQYFARPSEIDVLLSNSAAHEFFGFPRLSSEAVEIPKASSVSQ